MPKPIPQPDALSKPFWDAVDAHRLVLQNCTACNRKQYPPEPVCYQCGSAEHLEWKEVEGKGRIHGYCVMHDSRIRRLQVHQPFNIAIVELAEDPEIKFFSHLPGTPPDDVPVGADVEIYFEPLEDPGRFIHEWKVVQK